MRLHIIFSAFALAIAISGFSSHVAFAEVLSSDGGAGPNRHDQTNSEIDRQEAAGLISKEEAEELRKQNERNRDYEAALRANPDLIAPIGGGMPAMTPDGIDLTYNDLMAAFLATGEIKYLILAIKSANTTWVRNDQRVLSEGPVWDNQLHPSFGIDGQTLEIGSVLLDMRVLENEQLSVEDRARIETFLSQRADQLSGIPAFQSEQLNERIKSIGAVVVQ